MTREDPIANGDYDDLWPQETPTGSPVKHMLSMDIRNNVQQFACYPPMHPRQEYTEEIYHEEDDTYEYRRVVLSDEDFARRLEKWKVAMAEWERSGGSLCVQGIVDVEGEFVLEDGTKCWGMMGEPGQWLWMGWEMAEKKKRGES